ncbi:ABC transporter permease, partial [Sphingobacteriales bacterium CHB3]|nr:ABC transporter permease [Sphingobacteriales bacterium CHB3]
MSLFYYVLRRILEAVPLIFGLVTIVFFLSRLLPGSVTDALLSPTIPESVRDQLQRQFGLDRPLLEQYWFWLGSVFSGDLGMSLARHAPVADIIGEVFPNTILLAGAALFLEVVLGISLAAATFFTKRKRAEMALANALLVVYALPSFWVGIMLLVVFSYGLGVFPSSQMYT